MFAVQITEHRANQCKYLDKKWIMAVDLDSLGPRRFQSVSLSSQEKIGTEDNGGSRLFVACVVVRFELEKTNDWGCRHCYGLSCAAGN